MILSDTLVSLGRDISIREKVLSLRFLQLYFVYLPGLSCQYRFRNPIKWWVFCFQWLLVVWCSHHLSSCGRSKFLHIHQCMHCPNLSCRFRYYSSKHSSWWRRLKDALRTSFVFIFRRRLEDVLIKKTNMFALALHLQKTSSSRLQDVLVKTNIFVLATSSRRLAKTSSRRLEDVY